MCHRKAYWEKTASSEVEVEDEAETDSERAATERGWWGVRTADRRRGLVADAPDEREEEPLAADD